MNKWFQVWNRPEYKEWASSIPRGYLLVILRKEKNKYLCVKAKLLMGEKGLPTFSVLKEKRFPAKREATRQIQIWKSESGVS